jgi:UDP-GlcNAc:undecaprenyl-phosphate GlcNAc-1-phosphate transferase
MSAELQAILAFALAGVISGSTTPVMAHLARVVGFLDRPGGYKVHARPTPYLGGAAILLGVVAASLLVTEAASPVPMIVLAATAICVLGTIDDWHPIRPELRLAGQGAVAAAVWLGDAGWGTGLPAWAELVLTVGWVVLACNTFNLLDNVDGAAASVAAASALGIAVIGLVTGGTIWAVVVAAALFGACVSFLPFNLAKPARVFLGDGGSTLLGFLVAVAAMGALHGEGSSSVYLAAALLLAVPLLDTALVAISRRRQGVSLLTGGCDHLTHRIQSRLADPRKVALAVAATQAAVSLIAVFAVELGPLAIFIATTCCAVAAVAAITALEASGGAFTHTASRSRQSGGGGISLPTPASGARPR